MEFRPDSVVLSDGRRLAFAVLGPADGYPIVYLHGGIGTALTPEPGLVEAIERDGVQWIALSRPGFGGSDPHPERTMRTVAADVAELAASRGWRRIAVVGVSSGAPYALACAAEQPGLVAAVAVAAGLSGQCAPHRVPGLPLPARALFAALVAFPRTSIAVLERAARVLQRAEHRVARLAGSERAAAVRALTASVRHGVRGPVEDFLVCARPWDLNLAAIDAEVHLWHGLRDRIAPPEHAWRLSAALQRCSVWVSADEDHFFFRRCSAEIAAELVTAARRSAPAITIEDRRHGERPGCREPGRPARRGELGGRADRVLPRSDVETPWVRHPGDRGWQTCLDEVVARPAGVPEAGAAQPNADRAHRQAARAI